MTHPEEPSAQIPPPICRETLTASDGTELSVTRWPWETEGEQPLRGFLVGLHGIQSHAGWYGWSSRFLWESGWDVRYLDRRGSGRSGGPRGHAAHPDRLVNDVVACLRAVRSERDRIAPEVPVVLLGLSWGGKLAAVTAARRPDLLEALVLLYPGICTRIKPRTWQKLGLGAALAAGQDRKTAPIPLEDPALFTANPVWQEFIRTDERSLREATLRFFGTSAELDREVLSSDIPERITVPTLLMLAGRDRIVDNPAMHRWFARIPSPTTLIEYPHAAHTLEFEPERDRQRFARDLAYWLKQVGNMV